jgi:hypothetical protein
MSGSMTYRTYTSDGGVVYSLKCDESNANAIAINGAGVSSSALLPVRTVNSPLPPCSLKPRYANCYNQANPNQKRRFKFTTAAAVVLASEGATISAEDYPAGGGNSPGTVQTWIVASVRGEKSRKTPAVSAPDTGLTDGTVSQ